MIDGSEKLSRQLAFEFQNPHVCEKHSYCNKQATLHIQLKDLQTHQSSAKIGPWLSFDMVLTP